MDDTTGRFNKRPHFTRNELDVDCERVLLDFYRSIGRDLEFPILTEDLTILIETRTEDFDSCTDLLHEGDDVEGVTYFSFGEKPTVCISDKLSPLTYQNRLRTTLTHELFHVIFHDFLYQSSQQNLFGQKTENVAKCKRDNILNATKYDWMEWQAGYGCGAFLMPISALAQEVRTFRSHRPDNTGRLLVNSPEGQDLITAVANRFATSRDAARVRLVQQAVLQ